MESIINQIISAVSSLNPIAVNWSSAGDVAEYIFRVIIAAVVVVGVVTALTNARAIRSFFVRTFNELRKVEWLSRSRTLRLTALILVLIIASTLLLIIFDQTFLFARNLLIFRGI